VIRSHTTGARRGRSLLGALLSALILLLAALALPAAASAAAMYWGGTIKGEVWNLPGEAPSSAAVTKRFEEDTGKHITFVNTGQSWVDFDAPTMNAAIAAGAIPAVTMPLGEGVSLREVAEGRQDPEIRAWAREAKAFGYPFLFRPWWEVNGDWYAWGLSPDYVAAWRHFHDVVEEVGATNVTWAWVVDAIWSDPVSDPTQYYPGAGYVDWVGMDAYNWGVNPLQSARWLSAEESIEPTLQLLEQIAPDKPVCICESASTEVSENSSQTKAGWIEEMLGSYLPTHPQIKAYLWFNWNIEVENDQGIRGRHDWPIESSSAAQQAFRSGIAGPDYLSSLPPLTKLAKVPLPSLMQPIPTSATAHPAGESLDRGAPAASNRIAFGVPRVDATSGTAKLPVWFPGAGTLQLSGKGIRIRVVPTSRPAKMPLSRWIPQTGRLMLQVSASGAKRRALARRGEVEATVSARFSPLGGQPRTHRVGLTLRAG
jgi:hypothetical protein